MYRLIGSIHWEREDMVAYTDGDSFQREMDALLRVRENGSHPNICTLQENFEKRGNYYLVLDVLYIMLAGRHPFDPTGRATDEEIEEAIKKGSPPTRVLSSRQIRWLTLGALKYTRDQVWTSGLLEIRHTPLRLTHLPRLSVDTEAFDMWALGCVLYIMLAGRHPFDPTGRATDEEIEEAIKKGSPPTRDSPY
ncbi:LOW QUALITY PROTEIN: hypothetical protein ACHAWO_004452 [Cyclotella atomus]|uniref:Protein kinase domain-containing protein n=1 Tax=Cyclotella atomus TaxID=382360 RepID=A0ABD3NZ77_9STRA